MSYDPNRPLFDQAVVMTWNNTYGQESTGSIDADAEIRARMHTLYETSPGVFKALCASEGIDAESYAESLQNPVIDDAQEYAQRD